MSDFDSDNVNSDIQTSEKNTAQKSQEITNMLELLELMEKQIRWIKNLVNHNVYYSSIIDEIVVIQTELNYAAFLLLTENVKKCIAAQLQEGNLSAFDKLFITTGRILKL